MFQRQTHHQYFVIYFIKIIQQLNRYVMIRRKSTIDHAERQKRTKMVQIFSILDLCLQLPSDDRLLIRNCIKNGQQQPADRIYQCKKDKNYHQLQIWLRKYVTKQKDSNPKYGFNLGHGNKGKTPSTLKSKNPTESSTHNSRHNSLHSSPSTNTKKSATKISMTKLQIQKHIEQEINRQIKHGILSEQCQMQSRDITPREILKEIKGNQIESRQTSINNNNGIESEYRQNYREQKVSQFSKRISQNLKSHSILTMKDSIKHKIAQKQRNNTYFQNPICYTQANHTNKSSTTQLLSNPSYQFYKPREPLIIRNCHDNDRKSYNMHQKCNANNTNIDQIVRIEKNENSNAKSKERGQEMQYGQFYKRIKRVIDEAY